MTVRLVRAAPLLVQHRVLHALLALIPSQAGPPAAARAPSTTRRRACALNVKLTLVVLLRGHCLVIRAMLARALKRAGWLVAKQALSTHI